jgi:hypothetical protein
MSKAPGELGLLLDLEERLEQTLAQARADAARLVAAAEAATVAREAALEGELAAARAQLDTTIASERARREAEVAAAAARDAARFEAVPVERIQDLAQRVVGRLLGDADTVKGAA